ncbi:MAG: trypsin-like peptidase domain-containing protein [Elusimicrobia bacterium]|nr:trypsin-like peptidase domain-containing protein [Elusimicrobiota bacterium]
MPHNQPRESGEGFYSFEEAGHPKLQKPWKATWNIGFTWPSSCTGFYVSRNYFLTALHCVTNCRKDGQAFGAVADGHLYMNRVPASQIPDDFRCEDASLRLNTESAEPVNARIVATGSGAAITRARNFGSYTDAQFREFQERKANQSDWALVKVSRPSAEAVCVRTGELKDGESIWGIGFPAAAQRNHHSSDGRRKYVTRGTKSRGGFFGNAWLAKAKIEGGIARILADFYGDRMHWVTSDGYTGMSGGGIFDGEGRALGIYAVFVVDGEMSGGVGANEAYYSGANGYLKMTHIVAEAKALLGDERFREAFACVDP